ncbi:ACP phosphodiesterase [Silvimonas sp. JCM 19000]
MNYLAHALLGGPSAADKTGALLGDFVKGHLPGALPLELARGVALHRSIDAFTDAHPLFARSRERISSARRRYAGIMVDMFYDHLLARHWAELGVGELALFAQSVYGALDEHAAWLPPRLASIAPRMRQFDWLTAYRELSAVRQAIDSMSVHRLSQPNALAGAADELEHAYAGFEADFLAFWPEVCNHAAAFVWRPPAPPAA